MDAAAVSSRPDAPMAAPATPSRLDALGQRLRAARRERGMSQEALASPEFTKSYVSAVERGKVRPSLKALELLSRRLGVPMSDLLAALPRAASEPDIPAMEQDLEFQLAHARIMLNNGQAAESIRLLNDAQETSGAYLEQLKPQLRLGIPLQRAAAHLRLGEPAEARSELTAAMRIAQELPDGGESVERVRDLLGQVYYRQDMPHLALEQHRLCLDAIASGVVKDLNLRLTIYNDIANDYWALGDTRQAIGIYKEALDVLQDASYLERQAGIYWGLGLAQRSEGNAELARLYATRTLDILEARDNLAAMARMNTRLAEILIPRGEIEEAAQHLEGARATLSAVNDALGLSTLYGTLAELELARGRLEPAAQHALEALRLSETELESQPADANTEGIANTLRTYARSLRTAGVVAHKLDRHEEADRHFERAIQVLGKLDYDETAMEVELAYANLLAERGAHDKASGHYQAAFSYRNRRSMR